MDNVFAQVGRAWIALAQRSVGVALGDDFFRHVYIFEGAKIYIV